MPRGKRHRRGEAVAARMSDGEAMPPWHSILAGTQRGPSAATLRGVLRAASLPYGLACRAHHAYWDWREGERVAVPVISVGNLTVGGTGKTPTVAWLCRVLLERSVRPAILSRGYGRGRGAAAGELNDEGRELAARLPEVPHYQQRNRLAGARRLIERHRPDVIVLDDGFQHRRLARDLDLVLLDALCPFGYGHLLPRGLLREPLSALRRAHIVLLTRADRIPEPERQAIWNRVRELAPEAEWFEAREVPTQWVLPDGSSRPLADLRGCRLAAFCGIGNPQAFRRTLDAVIRSDFEGEGAVVHFHAFADHHPYQAPDVRRVESWSRQCRADWLVCTEKDLVKVRTLPRPELPLAALRISLAIQYEGALIDRIIATCRRRGAAP